MPVRVRRFPQRAGSPTHCSASGWAWPVGSRVHLRASPREQHRQGAESGRGDPGETRLDRRYCAAAGRRTPELFDAGRTPSTLETLLRDHSGTTFVSSTRSLVSCGLGCCIRAHENVSRLTLRGPASGCRPKPDQRRPANVTAESRSRLPRRPLPGPVRLAWLSGACEHQASRPCSRLCYRPAC